MKRSRIMLVVWGLTASLCLGGCEDDPSGACVFLNGCIDGKTEMQCDTVNGTLYVDTTCSQLRADKAAISRIMISEVYCQKNEDGIGLGWAEIYNGTEANIDLGGCSLVIRNGEGQMAIVGLDGMIGSRDTRVVGQADQGSIADIETGTSVALILPGQPLDISEPLTGIVFGADDGAGSGVRDDGDTRHFLGELVPDTSWELVSWPVQVWAATRKPDPHGVAAGLRSSAGSEPSFSTITGVY